MLEPFAWAQVESRGQNYRPWHRYAVELVLLAEPGKLRFRLVAHGCTDAPALTGNYVIEWEAESLQRGRGEVCARCVEAWEAGNG